MSNMDNGSKPNLFRRQFDDAQRQRLDVEGFWQSSKGAILGTVTVGIIAVTAIVISILNMVG